MALYIDIMAICCEIYPPLPQPEIFTTTLFFLLTIFILISRGTIYSCQNAPTTIKKAPTPPTISIRQKNRLQSSQCPRAHIISTS